MTDEHDPGDDLEQRLREDLGEIADAVPVGEPSAPPAANVVPITATTAQRRRPVLAIAGAVGAAAALLIGVLIWQSDDDGPGENVATQDPTTVPATSEPAVSSTVPGSTIPPATTVPPVGRAAGCPELPALAGATVQGETLDLAIELTQPPESGFFGADEGGAESFAASETFQVAAALPVRPVIDFVGERTAQEGPVLLWWASDDRVEAWVSAEGCATLGISVTGGTRDQNAQAAAELAFAVAGEAGLETTPEPVTDCPEPGAEPGAAPMLFFYCPFDDVDQIPRPVAPRDPFLDTPTEVVQTLFDANPPAGWGTAVPLEMRGATVEVSVSERGVAGLSVDYDFDAAPINGFSASAWAIAYSNQLQATLFQFPEVEAIDFDTICCGEWAGQVTRAEWETWLEQATQP